MGAEDNVSKFSVRQKFLIILMQHVGEVATNTRLGEFIYIAQEVGLIKPKLYDDFSFSYGTGIVPISFTLLKDIDRLKEMGVLLSGSVKIQRDYKSQNITLKEWNERILRAVDLLEKTETELAHFCTYFHYLKTRVFENEKDKERFASRSFLITRDCLKQIENYLQQFS
jgi:hypothetical protein